MNSTTDIARLKITMDDVEPVVMRRLEVTLGLSLDRLHHVLQIAIGWNNSHLWEFRAGDIGWGVSDPNWPDGPLDARKATLLGVLEDTGVKTLRYLYDFGDCWEHDVVLEAVLPAGQADHHPVVEGGQRACPPEDVGGAPGYEEFLEALADPEHAQHDDMVRWSGRPFDPEDARIDRIIERLNHLAKKWAPKPTKPKAP